LLQKHKIKIETLMLNQIDSQGEKQSVAEWSLMTFYIYIIYGYAKYKFSVNFKYFYIPMVHVQLQNLIIIDIILI
jgi:hypothetical protein